MEIAGQEIQLVSLVHNAPIYTICLTIGHKNKTEKRSTTTESLTREHSKISVIGKLRTNGLCRADVFERFSFNLGGDENEMSSTSNFLSILRVVKLRRAWDCGCGSDMAVPGTGPGG